MPAIVNLLFNVVSTNTTISFNVVLPLVSLVSLMLGLGGHLLMCLALVTNRRSWKKPGAILLLNLSLADICALLTLPCVLLSASFQDWQFRGNTCNMLGFMTSITVGVEIFSLSTLSVFRFYIVAPGTKKPVNLTYVQHECSLIAFHTLSIVVAIWLVPLAMALPKVTYINFDGGFTWSAGRDEWLFFLVPAFLVYYIGPLLCIAINCDLIISHLHYYRGSSAAHRRNKKATALLITSTVVFAISWLPYYALQFNVLSPYIHSVASPYSRFVHRFSSTSSPSYFLITTSGPSVEKKTNVSLLWELSSLAAILLVCLAPCWNPALYFLLSRPYQLCALLPSIFSEHPMEKRKLAQRWGITPVLFTPSQHQHSPVLAHKTCTELIKVRRQCDSLFTARN